jgi:hypothetical protein
VLFERKGHGRRVVHELGSSEIAIVLRDYLPSTAFQGTTSYKIIPNDLCVFQSPLYNSLLDVLNVALGLDIISLARLGVIVLQDPMVLDQIFVAHLARSFSGGNGLFESASVLPLWIEGNVSLSGERGAN